MLPEHSTIIAISAHTASDVQRLEDAIVEAARMPHIAHGDIVVTNARHEQALKAASQALTRAIDGLDAGLSGDLVSQDIRECVHHLGTITGAITTNDILGEIFAHFCVGK